MGGEAKGGLRQGGERSILVDGTADEGWERPSKRNALWDEAPAASALQTSPILALLPIFLAEVEATLPRPCWAQMAAETSFWWCGLLPTEQGKVVAGTCFLVAMVDGGWVEVGARLPRTVRLQMWSPLFDGLVQQRRFAMLGSLLSHSCGWWQRLRHGGSSGGLG
ncbi:hypothetical protein L7F22_011782 [Adiantum nelumboides]|nr:hypothetical protein [Adiantum nelumboides]